jgi:hypothetical protein
VCNFCRLDRCSPLRGRASACRGTPGQAVFSETYAQKRGQRRAGGCVGRRKPCWNGGHPIGRGGAWLGASPCGSPTRPCRGSGALLHRSRRSLSACLSHLTGGFSVSSHEKATTSRAPGGRQRRWRCPPYIADPLAPWLRYARGSWQRHVRCRHFGVVVSLRHSPPGRRASVQRFVDSVQPLLVEFVIALAGSPTFPTHSSLQTARLAQCQHGTSLCPHVPGLLKGVCLLLLGDCPRIRPPTTTTISSSLIEFFPLNCGFSGYHLAVLFAFPTIKA